MKRLTMAQWINLNWNNTEICVGMLILCIVKNWPYPPTASRSYDRQAGRPAVEITVSFKILKILYRLSYLCFYFACYHCNNATVYIRTASQSAFVK